MWERDGSYRFSEINEAYFDRAEEMLSVMKEYDMIPFLHLFWVNYIPDTWAAKVSPGTVIPFEKVRPLAAYMVERFAKYDPIYSVSGDTGFETEQVVRYYLEILDVLHEKDPQGLTTLYLLYAFAFWFLIGFGLVGYLCSGLFLRAFRRFTRREDLEDTEQNV